MSFKDLKLVAILDVHNTTGDVMSLFKGVMITEPMSHPTCEGIGFIRFHQDSVENQLTKFGQIHRHLKAQGLPGLSAAVMPDGMCAAPSEWAPFAAGIKAIDPAIKTILLAYKHNHERHPVPVDLYVEQKLRTNNHDAIKGAAGVPLSYEIPEDTHWLFRVQNEMDAVFKEAMRKPAPASVKKLLPAINNPVFT